MSTRVIARTPTTVLRKMWEIVKGDKATSFVIISASRANASPEANRFMDVELRRLLKDLRFRMVPLTGLGQEWAAEGGLPAAVKESSYLVAGVSRPQAEALCRRFDQDAVVFGKNGETLLLGFDRKTNTIGVLDQYESVALFRGKVHDPKTNTGVPHTPGTATYRSEGRTTPGIGFTFYNESDLADNIHEAARRLRAQGKITETPSAVQRLWMDLATRAEQAIQQMQEAGSGQADVALAKWKQVVKETARDPEGAVVSLIKSHAEVGV